MSASVSGHRARDRAPLQTPSMALTMFSKTTAVRYERERPGELVHVDVKSRQNPRRRRLAVYGPLLMTR